MRQFAWVVSVVALALWGCSSGPAEPVTPQAANPLVAQIVAIEGEVMTVETEAGDRFEFVIGDESVTVEHLDEHRRQKLPVKITFERKGEALVATRIDDA